MAERILYEVCCGCTEDAVNAQLGGADRIELNSALFLGGLTPSLGMLKQVKARIHIPVMAMVRPREGGFCYAETEYETIKEDAHLLLQAGADGLVFGFLNQDALVDERRTAELVALCGEREAVFSRAVDLCPDPVIAVEKLAALGVKRILTSGTKPSALEGSATIAAMIKAAGAACEILPGGGVKPENVHRLLDETGACQVHSSARKLYYDLSARANPAIFFGGSIEGKFLPEDEYKITDPLLVQSMRQKLDAYRKVSA